MAVYGFLGLVLVATGILMRFHTFRAIGEIARREAVIAALQAEFVTLLRVIGILGVAWVVLGIFMIVYGIGYAPGTYLRVSSNGIEYRLWMSYRIRCGWQSLDSIERRYSPLGVPYDVLYAKDAEMSGFAWRFLTGFSRCFHQWRTNYWIILNSFEGWPEGNLAEDVRRYAPQLFN